MFKIPSSGKNAQGKDLILYSVKGGKVTRGFISKRRIRLPFKRLDLMPIKEAIELVRESSNPFFLERASRSKRKGIRNAVCENVNAWTWTLQGMADDTTELLKLRARAIETIAKKRENKNK